METNKLRLNIKIGSDFPKEQVARAVDSLVRHFHQDWEAGDMKQLVSEYDADDVGKSIEYGISTGLLPLGHELKPKPFISIMGFLKEEPTTYSVVTNGNSISYKEAGTSHSFSIIVNGIPDFLLTNRAFLLNLMANIEEKLREKEGVLTGHFKGEVASYKLAWENSEKIEEVLVSFESYSLSVLIPHG